jgi:hypothetical protein
VEHPQAFPAPVGLRHRGVEGQLAAPDLEQVDLEGSPSGGS